MPILSELSVNEIQDLRREAGNFETHANDLSNIAQRMFEEVENTSSIWSGRDQQTYAQQFLGLEDDMNNLFEMVSQYCTDLNEIADSYQTANDDNVTLASSLQTDIPLV